MAKYTVFIERRVLKSLSSFSEDTRRRIIKAINALEKNPRPIGAKKLSGREGWRIRIGNYRVIYEIEDHNCKVLVVDADHRKDIYR